MTRRSQSVGSEKPLRRHNGGLTDMIPTHIAAIARLIWPEFDASDDQEARQQVIEAAYRISAASDRDKLIKWIEGDWLGAELMDAFGKRGIKMSMNDCVQILMQAKRAALDALEKLPA